MNGTSRGSTAIVLVVLIVAGLALPLGAAVVAADDHGNETVEENETVEGADTGPYDLGTLRSAGQQPPNAPPSVRAMGSTTTLWVEYAPTGFMRTDDADNREDIEPGTEVRRDTVYFRSSRPWDAPDKEITLVLVYWQEGETEEVTEDGRVVREPAAVNQTVDRKEITLSSGYGVEAINLRKQYDEPMNVAMFVEDREGDVQWSFVQVSSEATKDVAISTLGGAVKWAFLWMFLPFAVVLIGVLWVDQKILERAGAGPQYKTSEYVALAFFGSFFLVLFAYEWVIDVVARAPWAVGIFAGLGFGLIVVELFGDDTYKDLFLRFDLEDVETREDGSGIMRVEAIEKKLVDLEDGTTGVVRDGLRAFVARARGAIPRLDTGPLRRETQVDVEGKWRNLHLVDPSADSALEYEPAEWDLGVIDFDANSDKDGWMSMIPSVDVLPVMIGLGVVYAGYALSLEYLGTGLIGFLVAGAAVLGYWATPHAGIARTRLAPMHFDAVVTNVLTFAKGLEETADRDFYRRKYHQTQGENLAQRRAEREDSEQSRMEAIMDRLAPDDVDDDLGERGPDPGVTSDDD